MKKKVVPKSAIIEGGFALSRAENKSLTSEAYYKIKQMLYNQGIVPGQKIIYEDLANTFRMSTTPIINALSRLEQDGLVILKYNRGYFVTEISEKEAEYLLEARQALEEYSVKKLIDISTDEKIQFLEKILKRLKAYRPNSYTKKRLFMDSVFHVGIAEMAGNPIVKEMLRFIFERIYLRYRTERIALKRMDEADKEHTILLNAIKKKNLPLALKVLDGHFIKVKKNLLLTIRTEM